VFSRMSSVPQVAWDSVVSTGGFYASHAWLRGQETADWAQPLYVLAEDEIGPVAAAVGWTLTSKVYSLPEISVDEDDVLLVGGRTGYRNELLVRGGADSAAVFPFVLTELVRAANDHGRRWLLFDYLDTESLLAIGRMAPVSYILREADAVLDNPGRTFTSYLAGLTARRRRRIMHEIRVFDAAGYRVELRRLSECVGMVAGIMAATMRKYGTDVAESGIRAFLEAQAACVDEQSAVFICLDGSGEVVGCCVCFVWRDASYARVAGFDYARLRDAFEYFNVVYYHPLRYLETQGLRRLYLGVDSLHAKWLRGADLYPTWAGLIDVSTYGGGPPGLTGLRPASDEAIRDEIRQLTHVQLSPLWFPATRDEESVDGPR
jgi:hypothetical protein